MAVEPTRFPHRWLRAFWAVLGAVLMAWLVLPLAARGADLPANRWIREGLRRKLAAAEGKHGKVVLLGGSSVHFGLSAGRLERVHGVPAVNLGQHAGLGLRYILHYARPILEPGDVVVLSLEYGLWERESVQAPRTFYLLAHDIRYVYAQGPLGTLRFLAGVRPDQWFDLIHARLSPSQPGEVPGYQASTIDAFGDETANLPEQRPVAVVAALLAEPVARRLRLDRSAIDLVAGFARRLAAERIRVVVAHPGQLRRQFDWGRNHLFYEALSTGLEAARVVQTGRPEEAVFDGDCVFDTAYHQVRPCVETRSDQLFDALVRLSALPRPQGTPR